MLARDIKHLGTYDGSGLLVGHWPWETVLQVMDSVAEELDKGSRVLVCCRNGSSRSATWIVAILMVMTGNGLDAVQEHVSAVRAVVNLSTYHARSLKSRFSQDPDRAKTPLQWLRETDGKLKEWHAAKWQDKGFTLNSLLPPEYRAFAKSLGYVELHEALKLP